MGRRGRSKGVGRLLAVLSFACLIAAPAAVAEIKTAPLPDEPLLGHVKPKMTKILSPREDSVIGRGSVRVRVRVAPAVRRFRATLGSRRITKLFSSPRGGIRTAVVPVGKRLKLGRNHLTVETHSGRRSDYDAANFQVARRDTGFITLDARPSALRNEHVGVQIRLAAGAERLTARLNGRRVDRRLRLKGKRLRRGRLDVDDGMRFGANTLVVTAYRGGRFDREVYAFRVDRRRALVGAGRPKTVMAGLPLELDGTASRPTVGGRAIRYRWRMTGAPRGSKVKLRGAGTATPSFTPPTNGRYTFKLTASEPGAPPAGSDTVTVAAQPDAPPIGVPIETIPSGGGGITLGGQSLVSGGGWIQMAVLERDTLAVNRQLTGTFGLSELGSFQAALSQVRQPSVTDAGELLILTGAGHDVGQLSSGWASTLKAAWKQFGGTLAPFPAAAANGPDPGFGGGEWSLIGVKGTDAGQATQQQFEAPPGQQDGGLGGYLQLGTSPPPDSYWPVGYGFVFGNYVPFNTNVPGQPANQVQISIGSEKSFVNETFTSKPLGPGESGFYVLLLDQGTLQAQNEFTAATNDASGNQIVSGVNDLAGFIGSQLGAQDPALVIVQSIGTPSAQDPSWQALNGIQYLMDTPQGSLDVFNYPADSIGLGGYTLVGGIYLTGPAVEENTAVTRRWGHPPLLTGVLSQNRQSQWVADLSDPTGSGNPEQYLGIVSQPGQAWPVPDDPGEQAAMAYIASEISPALTDQTDVRPNYWLEALGFDWDTSLLTAVPPPPEGSGISEADFNAVIAQLLLEFPIVQGLNSYYTDLQKEVLAGTAVSQGSLQGIASKIETDVQPPPQKTTDFDEFLDIFTAVTSNLGTFIPVGGPAIGAFSAAAEIIGELDNGPSGGNTLLERVTADAGQLQESSAEAAITIFNNLDKAYDLLVSDWGRLRDAGRLVDQWNTQTALSQYLTGFIKSFQQYIYTELVGVAYNVFAVQGTSFPGNECIVFGGELGPLAGGLVNPGGWDFFVDYGQENNLTSKVLTTAFSDEIGIQPGNAPGANVIGPMFNPDSKDNRNPNWAGMYPQYFYGRNYPAPPSVICSGA